ncbi:hypothetical protein CMQ_2897 [Grosmannia clavigera kw1407]|uniref:Uncharacterized protein n=1 Tax=Grosmannia clavigera (strain kw1407 / UAMH 11150) TaxID=655863 RepID=F0XHD6_GROCL|nr:uncharacterized protein CMQ_2897 [Grosmannia clavigera kw1407]EFX02968.1 hypothetical protein CMQ_2897 [Grosmannia clavigera kw1407]
MSQLAAPTLYAQCQQPSPPLAPPRMLFCVSLQDRPAWAPVVPVLLTSRTEPRWQKARLGSHDLAVCMQFQKTSSQRVSSSSSATAPPSDIFRFFLVAPEDVGQLGITKRLQRLCQRKSGLGRAVVFLLQAKNASDGDSSDRASMAAYQQLQIEYVSMRVRDKEKTAYLMAQSLGDGPTDLATDFSKRTASLAGRILQPDMQRSAAGVEVVLGADGAEWRHPLGSYVSSSTSTTSSHSLFTTGALLTARDRLRNN